MRADRETPTQDDVRSAREARLAGRLRRRRRRRRLPPLSVFPTLCTLGNLLCGFAAIYYSTKLIAGPWNWSGLTMAALLVFLGMVFDAIDGSLARLTQSTTELGAQLDSLADIVTFGVAPAFMTIMLINRYVADGLDPAIIGPAADTTFGRIIWGVAAVYVCCAALRLARFNVETPSAAAESHLIFRGLPSPGAAGAVVSLILLQQHLEANFMEDVPHAFVRAWAMGIPFIVGLCAFAMVSSLPYVHIINRYFRGQKSFRYIVYLVIPLVLLIWYFQFVLAIAFCAYAISAPAQQIGRAVRRWLRKSKQGQAALTRKPRP